MGRSYVDRRGLKPAATGGSHDATCACDSDSSVKEDQMTRVSRRDFGKSVSRGALGALAATSVPPLASPQGEVSTTQSAPKRMTTVLRELIKSPGLVDSPSVHDPLTAKI